MDGANILTFTLSAVPKAINTYLENQIEDYDFVIMHQQIKYLKGFIKSLE